MTMQRFGLRLGALFFAASALVAAAAPVRAADSGPDDLVGWKVSTGDTPAKAKAGEPVTLPVVLDVAKGHYVYQPHTEITLDAATKDATLGAVTWPKADKQETMPPKNELADVWTGGRHELRVAVTIAKPGAHTVVLDVRSQACNEDSGVCLFPNTQRVTFTLPVGTATASLPPTTPSAVAIASAVGDGTTPIAVATAAASAATPSALAIASPAEDATSIAIATPAAAMLAASPSIASAGGDGGGSWFTDENVMAALIREHFAFALLIALAGGLLISGTPCVYPMIPITISVIGSQVTGASDARASRAKGFFLSLIYVAGITLVYSTLGLIAAETHRQFAFLLQSEWVRLGVAVVFVALAASMFGAFSLQLPGSVQTKLMTWQGKGWIGVFITGLFAGIVAGPCTAPVLVGILLAISAGAVGPLGGFLLMASFSLGMGVLFIVLGTFSGLLSTLPSGGPWMETVKHAFGALLLAAALYYLKLALPPFGFAIALGATLVGAGVWLGVGRALAADASGRDRFAKAAGILATIAGIWFFLAGLATSGWGPDWLPRGAATTIASSSTPAPVGIAWVTDETDARARATREHRPVLVDFWATWCGDCLKLDDTIYSDPRVIAEVNERFVPLKLDDSNKSPDLQSRYTILGLPTVVFLRPDGSTMDDLSMRGLTPDYAPSKFVDHLQRAEHEASAQTCTPGTIRC